MLVVDKVVRCKTKDIASRALGDVLKQVGLPVYFNDKVSNYLENKHKPHVYVCSDGQSYHIFVYSFGNRGNHSVKEYLEIRVI